MGVELGEVVRMDLVARHQDDNDVVNVFQFSPNATVADNADVLDDLIEIAVLIVTIIRAIGTGLTVWERIRAQNISTGEIIGEASLSPTLAGTLSGDPGASQIAAVLTMKTGIPHVNLRKYLGPVAESRIGTDGRLSSGTIDIMVDLAALLMSPIAATQATWVYGHLSPAAGQFVIPNVAVTTNVPATQRRRRLGVGS